ncbi:MAG: phenylacetate-CoA oxygenase subunit PaaJ [Anaerolineae bacterium]|nr:phenylacetate-CoA oxygenase subunit PaaJ [Anaerolineae bacterium]
MDIEAIWRLLDDVKDPEIPVVSLVEMGVVRAVKLWGENAVTVSITPTFSACPALQVMKAEIVQRLQAAGIADVEVNVVYSPPWTTDWIDDEAKEKMRAFGLAPAPRHGGSFEVTLLDEMTCPYCGSLNTSLRNSFGSTPCRMIYYCNACQQPFEQMKPL